MGNLLKLSLDFKTLSDLPSALSSSSRSVLIMPSSVVLHNCVLLPSSTISHPFVHNRNLFHCLANSSPSFKGHSNVFLFEKHIFQSLILQMCWLWSAGFSVTLYHTILQYWAHCILSHICFRVCLCYEIKSWDHARLIVSVFWMKRK